MTPQAHARRTDPKTSHDAAKSVNVTEGQQLILDALEYIHIEGLEPATSQEIRELIDRRGERISESGVRTSLTELVRAGKVEIADREGLTPSGRHCTRYWLALPDPSDG